ncbi:MAG TPA: hypothetical protein VM327_08155 [Candidatus Thermoplasmatota archaeon]|nr:hypothetical protein [Candidatus Thermoplasmatota archaeon]
MESVTHHRLQHPTSKDAEGTVLARHPVTQRFVRFQAWTGHEETPHGSFPTKAAARPACGPCIDGDHGDCCDGLSIPKGTCTCASVPQPAPTTWNGHPMEA